MSHTNNTATTPLLAAAEQTARAIDWSDESLDLNEAFAKIRSVLAAKNAASNAVLKALSVGGEAAMSKNTAGTSTASLTASVNSQVGGQNSVVDETVGSTVPDPLIHMPTGITSIGIYFFSFSFCFL